MAIIIYCDVYWQFLMWFLANEVGYIEVSRLASLYSLKCKSPVCVCVCVLYSAYAADAGRNYPSHVDYFAANNQRPVSPVYERHIAADRSVLSALINQSINQS